MSETYDEPDYVSYGVAILHGKPDRFRALLDSKMPVSALNALPLVAADYLQHRGKAPRIEKILRDIRARRYGTIAAAFCLCLLVFLYAESLFGRTAGLFAQSIFVMEPNIIAHSTLATNDLYVAFGTVLALYFLRRYLLAPTTWNATLAAFAFALAQLMKFTAFFIYAVFFIALIAAILYSKYGREPRVRISPRQGGILVALTVAAFLFVINAGFLFDRTFTPLDEYTFHSPAFQALQKIPVLSAVPLPLPYPYLQGFDWVSSNNTTGVTFGNMVLFNEVRGQKLKRSGRLPIVFHGCVCAERADRPADRAARESGVDIQASAFWRSSGRGRAVAGGDGCHLGGVFLFQQSPGWNSPRASGAGDLHDPVRRRIRGLDGVLAPAKGSAWRMPGLFGHLRGKLFSSHDSVLQRNRDGSQDGLSFSGGQQSGVGAGRLGRRTLPRA